MCDSLRSSSLKIVRSKAPRSASVPLRMCPLARARQQSVLARIDIKQLPRAIFSNQTSEHASASIGFHSPAWVQRFGGPTFEDGNLCGPKLKKRHQHTLTQISWLVTTKMETETFLGTAKTSEQCSKILYSYDHSFATCPNCKERKKSSAQIALNLKKTLRKKFREISKIGEPNLNVVWVQYYLAEEVWTNQ